MRSTKSGLFAEETLTFDYIEGAVSPVTSPYTTGWRSLPYAVVCQWQGTRIRLDLTNQEHRSLDNGEGLIIPANIRHCVTTLSDVDARCRWGHLQYRTLGSLSLLSLLPHPVFITPESGKVIGDLLEELSSIEEDKGRAFSLASVAQCNSLGFRLLTVLCEVTNLEDVSSVFFSQAARLLPVLNYVYESTSLEITRELMAEKAGLSPTHLHTLFKKMTGTAPMDYVRRLRLQRAQALLVETDLTVSQIAERVGIGDPFYFSRQFKRLCGVSPTQYRQETRGSLFPKFKSDRSIALESNR